MIPSKSRIGPNITRLVALVGALGLTALIAWAVQTGDFGAAGAWLTSHPWGLVTLGDLYFGFLIAAFFIAGIERDWRWRLFWILPLPLIGNVWAGLWLCLRAGRVRDALRSRTDRDTN
ncbi:hypothetical protein AWH62_06005 [Maricaulis sp. W15]|uniref:hypothetical protein n=1 Tax=Maricaulis sp. W15 TaxID=1772333 RepID=UPI000948EA3A|nr:hypothetical protein [Maricaulis sp. W15]OLF75374.1 hypothetical protein AWH62_06005 [Maricaulis sp. W15]